MEQERIFALDIGTRKIIGLVMEKRAGGYHVLDSEMIEHRTRAMLDGQIHDVEAIAETIGMVKKNLEERLHMPLEKAAVAAAGRALKTSQGMVKKKRASLSEIKPQEVRALEIEAVQEAQYRLAADEKLSGDRNHYICAGYSVVYYALEGQKIASLSGHIGTEIEVKIIATFLPRVVVDSLFSSLKKAGLDTFSLTLEPIAAISIAIPDSMRLLNLVLVDIGAGTSDIAVIKENNVYAYAMVPWGGDKLTESIASTYLLDFNQAEEVKKAASRQEKVAIMDILGNRMEIEAIQIQETLHNQLHALTDKIAEQILSLNQQVPDAVICVGGGSLTPDLTAALADKLNLVKNRVGIKTADTFQEIVFSADYLNGPQGVTPLGIAYHSFKVPPLPFIRVFVNGREVTLWNAGKLNVGLGLLNSGISLNNIYGKPGMGKTIQVNGEINIFKGSLGQAPIIKVNGEMAELETIVEDGGEIVFSRGKDGEDARVFLSDLLAYEGGTVTVNGEKIDLKPVIYINGKEYLEGEDVEIEDRAKIEYRNVNAITNVLALAKVPEHALNKRRYEYTLDGQPLSLEWNFLAVKVDGQEAALSQKVKPGALIEYTLFPTFPRIKDVMKAYAAADLAVTVNDEAVQVKAVRGPVMMNGRLVSDEEELLPGAELNVQEAEQPAILSDIFQTLKMASPPKGSIKIKVDGQEAGFTTPIKNNSKIEISWDT